MTIRTVMDAHFLHNRAISEIRLPGTKRLAPNCSGCGSLFRECLLYLLILSPAPHTQPEAGLFLDDGGLD